MKKEKFKKSNKEEWTMYKEEKNIERRKCVTVAEKYVSVFQTADTIHWVKEDRCNFSPILVQNIFKPIHSY